MNTILLAALIGCTAGDAACAMREEPDYTHVVVCDVIPGDRRVGDPVHLGYQMDGERYIITLIPRCEQV